MTSTGLGDSGEAFAGALLVATPLIDEPTFRRAVVLLLEHSDGGSLGVVLNEVSQLSTGVVLPGWEDVLFDRAGVGGPVQGDAGVAVARLTPVALGGPPQGVQLFSPPWAVLDLSGDPDEVAGSVADGQLFLGYAGWEAGQLANELRSGSWWVVDSEPDDLALGRFGDDRDEPWRQVVGRQRTDLRYLRTYPDDPSWN